MKMSHLEGIMNKLVIYIVITQLTLACILAILSKFWQEKTVFDSVVIEQKNSENL